MREARRMAKENGAVHVMDYNAIQAEEARTWLIEDPKERKEKAQRELIRYPLLKKQMGLDYLDTSDMEVWDIGAGPLGGVSSLLRARKTVRIDPLADEYKRFFPCYGYEATKAEDLKARLAIPDLVIVTNALDHMENPAKFLQDIVQHTRPSTYFAHSHAIDNAITHPHDAHQHNVNPQMVKEALSEDFELVWNLDYEHDGTTYGWRKQPSFHQLWRKVTGYTK